METNFVWNQYGYITDYLVSGLEETPLTAEEEDRNQLAFEKKMRLKISDNNKIMPEGTVAAGAASPVGGVWRYYYSYGNWFVDQSAFYPLLTRVEFHSATMLVADQDMETDIWLWSFAAVDIWVNGTWAGGLESPVYKPINRKILRISLKKGENLIYIRLLNLGVRDTKSLFAIQIPGKEREQISVTLPTRERVRSAVTGAQWLSGIRLKGGKLLFPYPAPKDSRIVYDRNPVDFEEYSSRYISRELEGKQQEELLDISCFKVTLDMDGQCLKRSFERQELLAPLYGNCPANCTDMEENLKRVYLRIAQIGQIPRGDGDSFSMYPVLARYYLDSVRPEDEGLLLRSLDQIESRRDCSDFLSCAMVRFMKLYPMSGNLKERCRKVMLSYRYWMDEQGSDGMCFWSENHSLMFFVSAYIAGDVYEEEHFLRSGKTGKEMKQESRKRIYDWLKDVTDLGFDEFHSGGYTPITFAAILNVVDFGDEELSQMAWKAADKLFQDLAVQTFRGVSIAPMGRVYREVLYPFSQDIQSMVNLIDPETPYRFSEWIIFLATSKYSLPVHVRELMEKPLSLRYQESNARICVEKTAAYMLTSVESPRTDGIERQWENISGDENGDTGSFHYVKSLNECFHGTTQFQPGVFGYQQHLWYAALDCDTAVFVNHPGSSCEGSSTRPGYWFGNGIMPALKQDRNKLYAIYRIPETHPIPFIHLYWPQSRFQQEKLDQGWIAGKKREGYVAVWTSEDYRAYEDQLESCEYRIESRDSACLCVCGSREEYESLETFLETCKALKPEYDKDRGCLTTAEDQLIYEAFENRTQYV